MKRIVIIVVVALVIVGVVAWRMAVRPRWTPITANPAIRELMLDGKRVRVRLAHKGDLGHVVDLTPFQGLRPIGGLGLVAGFERVEFLLGKPDDTRIEKGGFFVHEYWLPNGRVDVRCEARGDADYWSLAAYPGPISYRDVFAKEMAWAINSAQDETLVLVLGEQDELLMLVVLKGSRVETMRWYYHKAMNEGQASHTE